MSLDSRRIGLLILVLSMMLVFANPYAVAEAPKKVGIDVTPNRIMGMSRDDAQQVLQWMQDTLPGKGFEVVLLEEINSNTLKDLDALILGKIDKPEYGYSNEEVKAIAEWFKQGGKFIWTAADSDYTEPYLDPNDITFKAKEPNKILEAIGATIRVDYMSVEDPENNAGAPYRVVANRSVGGINDHPVTKNVDTLLVHGPAGLAGFIDGKWVDFETLLEKDKSVTWLARTGESGTVVSHDKVPPNAYEVGYTGRLYLVAVQEVEASSSFTEIVYGKVLVSGDSPYGGHHMTRDEYKGVSLDGTTFFINAIEWGTEVKKESNLMGLLGILLAVIVVVAAVAYIFLKRR